MGYESKLAGQNDNPMSRVGEFFLENAQSPAILLMPPTMHQVMPVMK